MKKNNIEINKIIISLTVLIILVILFIILNKHFKISQKIESTLINSLEWINSFGKFAPIVFGLIYILCTVLFISGAILMIGSGIFFGVIKGSIIASFSSTLGALTSFLISRFFLKGWISKKIEKFPKFKAIDAAVAKDGWKIVGLTRLSPLLPFVLLNYVFGLTKISLKNFFLASWIGMIPEIILYSYIGSLIDDIASIKVGEKERSPIEWIFTIIGLIITVIITIYITNISKKALSNKLDE